VGDYNEAFNYYFDVILKPYSKFMLKAIDKIRDLPLTMICPGHGPILRSTWKEKMEHSAEIASQYLEETNGHNRVLVAYVSAYGYTKRMAVQVATGLKKAGIQVDLVDIENILLGDLEELVVKANGILIGSPTINQNTLLPVYKLFSVINPIRDKGKPGAAFGSFGWSGEAVKLIEDHLRNLKLKVVLEGQTARFYPNKEESQRLIQMGEKFAEFVRVEA
jgi:flavorubredoxin